MLQDNRPKGHKGNQMAKKMNMHSGSRAMQARLSDEGDLSLFQSNDPVDAEGASQLDDDSDFEQVAHEANGDDNDDFLSCLMSVLQQQVGAPQPDEKFQAFLAAIQAGNRDLAIQLLHEHDEETGDGPGEGPATAEEEAARVDEMIADAADQQAGAASNAG